MTRSLGARLNFLSVTTCFFLAKVCLNVSGFVYLNKCTEKPIKAVNSKRLHMQHKPQKRYLFFGFNRSVHSP